MKIFISHHHNDIAFAQLAAAKLKEHGISSWIAGERLEPGQTWTTEIDNALRESDAVIVILSANTRTSEYVTYEWAFALGLEKRIIPLLINEAEQHPKLWLLQRLDFRSLTTFSWEGLVKALNAIQASASAGPVHVSAPPSRAMEHLVEVVQAVPELVKEAPLPPPPKRAGTRRQRDVMIVVDVQNDFFSAGAMATVDADTLLGPLNKAIDIARSIGMKMVFTRDWHPADHGSFVQYGGKWPIHCVQGTRGADFHEALVVPPDSPIVNIGSDSTRAGLSPFEDAEMDRIINRQEIDRVYVAGIALEYCVQATCIEAVRRGKKVVLCRRLVRAATSDPVRLNDVCQQLGREGVEVSADLIPFAPG